jgi:hypothetical protein
LDRLDVLAVGNDTRLRTRIDGDWGTQWEALGGYINSLPKLVVLNDTAVAVFGIELNGSLVHGLFPETTGREWGQERRYNKHH